MKTISFIICDGTGEVKNALGRIKATDAGEVKN